MQSQISQGKEIFDYIDDYQFMPDGFSVTVVDNEQLRATVEAITRIEHIQSADSSPQVAEFLRELRRVVTLIAGAAIIALAAVSMIMISNTTKASVFARREEIQIMKYVGATNAFIRTPFFVEGMITGFLSGTGAFMITWLTYDSLYGILTEKVGVMNVIGLGNILPFDTIRFYVLGAYLLTGAFVGALGSVLFTRKHINV
jgi:cell division transport system permease protein